MKLADLEPQFLKRGDSHTFDFVTTLAEADGIEFLCPKCFAAKGGPVGTHGVICWAPSVPQDTDPRPGRWSMSGSGFDDLTLTASSSSISLMGGCNAHFFIRNGQIEMC